VEEYTELETRRTDIPGYSIASIMDCWITTENKIVPMFLQMGDIPTSEDDVFHKVTAVDRYRPDLISYRYYETVNYMWVILLANSIFNPFEIEVGTVLRIPSRSVILGEWLL